MKKFIFLVIILTAAALWAWDHYSSKDLLNWSQNKADSPLSEKIDYYVGMYHYAKNENGMAAEAFSQLLTGHATSQYAPEALFKRGQAYRNMRQYDRALEDFSRFLKLYPEHKDAVIARRNEETLKYR
ncbi:MAG: tetratricopeptide repeat protein [bacterium]